MYLSAVRRPFIPSVPELAHATVSNTFRSNVSIGWCGNHTISALVSCQESSTSVEVHHSYHTQIFFNLAEIYRWMTCFWWQLAHNIPIQIIRLSLKKGCFEIHLEMIPTFALSCQLATHAKVWSCGSRLVHIDLLRNSAWSRKPRSTQLAFATEEVAQTCRF